MDFGALKPLIEEATAWIRESGLSAQVLEERHVVLRLPRDRHLNRVGHVHGGAALVLMEMAGAALLACTYPFGRYVPIHKAMEIQFLGAAATDLFCELTLSESAAAEMVRPIDEKGKGEWVLEVHCRDAQGTPIAKAVCTYYVKKMT
jgi:acyl-coenzyme A thioesterase PaaI-like protein